jgi:hypothetical protein
MVILTVIFAFSIIFLLIVSILLVVGMPVTKGIKIAVYFSCLPSFFGAMLLLATIGEIERLNKEKIEKYEMVNETFYRKIK